MDIDTLNRHAVGIRGGKIVILLPPSELTPDAALVFAAHIVALAEFESTHSFDAVLSEVQGKT
jgi:hypothetical protein